MGVRLKHIGAGLAEAACIILAWHAMEWITGWQMPTSAFGIACLLYIPIQFLIFDPYGRLKI